MSNGFASSNTKAIPSKEREILSNNRSKLLKRLDVFTDDFAPPGPTDVVPGVNPNKDANPYQDKHDDTKPEAKKNFTLTDEKSKEWSEHLSNIDHQEHLFNAGIKKPSDQFPGYASDNPTIPQQATDTSILSKLKDEVRKTFGVKPDPVMGIQSASDHYMKGKK